MMFCRVDDCGQLATRRGFCQKHYIRFMKYGDPLFKKGPHKKSVSHGYLVITHNGKQRLEHRVNMEKKLGRPLLPTEVVHHKDENRKNNEPENLELFTNKSAHTKHHWNLRNSK